MKPKKSKEQKLVELRASLAALEKELGEVPKPVKPPTISVREFLEKVTIGTIALGSEERDLLVAAVAYSASHDCNIAEMLIRYNVRYDANGRFAND